MSEIKILIKEELELIRQELENINIDSENIKTDIYSFLFGSSKKIRTILPVLYLKANSQQVSRECIKIISAGEIIHNASLLHDDVIDGAKTRRGISTIGEKYSSKISILTGDYLLSLAIEKLLEINNYEVLKIFLNCTKRMCNSEINQYFLRGNKPTLEEYIEICKGKTAGLFVAILQSCCLVQNIPTQHAVEFAEDFGILFQLHNDLQTTSALTDKSNKIFTPQDFLGIEKTRILIDNYQEGLINKAGLLPNSDYREALEGLTKNL